MPERPLLILPTPFTTDRPPGWGFGPRLMKPAPRRQRRRLEPQYQRLMRALNGPGGLMSLRDDPTSIAPERAIVFEIAGSVQNFYRAARRIAGLEFLAEEEQELAADDDFAALDREGRPRPGEPVPGRRYLVMPTVGAFEEILALYRRWRRNREMPRNFTPWRDLFLQLRTLRPWGPADRISDAAIDIWEEEIAEAGVAEVLVEAELWFHDDPDARTAALAEVRGAADELGGELVMPSTIVPIAYQAALLRVPVPGVRRIMAREEVALVLADQVMFLNPQSSVRAPRVEVVAPEGRPVPAIAAGDLQPAIAALLDGFPVQQHALLAGRLNIDDGDGLEARATVSRRMHGTAMASLILHGDLNEAGESLRRVLHVRPILFAPEGQIEQTVPERLLVDTIYRAVVSMKDPDTPGGPTAPNVFLVNLSLGDRRRPFTGPMNSLGRLLDFLSDRYGLLFLVSAGNTTEPFEIADVPTMAAAEGLAAPEVTRLFLGLLKDQAYKRTLLSPAEALNPLTIGAAHADAVPAAFPYRNSLDPFPGAALPNVSSAVGLGHRRVVKPDLLMPGGKERVAFRGNQPLTLGVPEVPQGFGLRAAAPDPTGRGALDRRALSCGTSAGTALATRMAYQIHDVIMDADGGSNHADLDPEYWAVVVKALMVHGARWPEASRLVGQVFGPADPRRHTERADNIAKLLGYGIPEIARVVECTPSRATLVGYGALAQNQAHEFRIPLPECLEAVTDPRSVILTLAWMSPVTAVHPEYRRAQLQMDAPGHGQRIGVKRVVGSQPSDAASKRGTVIHEIHEGENAVAFVDEGALVVRVWCLARPDHADLPAPVRYGLAVTIEAGTELPVYDEINVRLRERIAERQG